MNLRETNISKLPLKEVDVLIVGGGINGAVSPAALAGKGAKTALIDKGDFGGMTSQESSNLVLGRYKISGNIRILACQKTLPKQEPSDP